MPHSAWLWFTTHCHQLYFIKLDYCFLLLHQNSSRMILYIRSVSNCTWLNISDTPWHNYWCQCLGLRFDDYCILLHHQVSFMSQVLTITDWFYQVRVACAHVGFSLKTFKRTSANLSYWNRLSHWRVLQAYVLYSRTRRGFTVRSRSRIQEDKLDCKSDYPRVYIHFGCTT